MNLSVTVQRKTADLYNILVDTLSASGYRTDHGQSSTDLSITVQASYSFSTRLKGGMNTEWTDRAENSSTSGRRKSHVRALAIWAEFSF